MKILLPNQHFKFTVESLTPTVLVKTGVIGDGSCFIHCILHSISSDYRDYDISKRMSFVSGLRASIAEKTSLDYMKLIGKGELFRISFIDVLRQTVKEISPVPFEFWDNKVIPSIANEWKSVNTDDAIAIINSKYTLNISLESLFHKISTKVLDVFRYKLAKEWIDAFNVEYYAWIFRKNFIIVDFSTLTGPNPFIVIYPEEHPFDKYIIISWIDDCHYEAVGEIVDSNVSSVLTVESETKSKIKRQFTKNDEIVKTLSCFSLLPKV